MTRPLVIYHGPGCMDGAGAALAAWKKLGDEAEYRPAQYGDPPPTDEEVRGREVFILDFSYPRAELLRLCRAATSLLVIDHHKTAQEDCENLRFCIFDMKLSGAVLAWLHFHDELAPLLLQYIQDRDLWKWELPRSREVSAALAARGCARDFRLLDQFLELKLIAQATLSAEGEAILRYQGQLVDSICRHAREVEIAGHRVLMANAPILQSEVGERLAQGRAFGAAWFVDDHGRRVVSLRSRPPSGIDVSQIAKLFGGGGHPGAAGYTEPPARVDDGIPAR